MTKSSLSQTLSAYGEVIRGQQDAGKEHEPTPTEYFAVVSSTLGQADQSSPDFLAESLRILDAVTAQAARAVVRGQFRSLSATYLQIITLGTDNATILKAALQALGSLLYVQECGDTFWSSITALQCVNTLLSFLEDANMKLRRAAHDQLLRLLTLHQQQQAGKALRCYVGDFCMGILRTCTRAEYKRSLYIVLFLESAAPLLPEEGRYSVGLLQAALGLQAAGQPVLIAAALRMVDCFFQAPEYNLQPAETVACVSLLASTPLQTKDMESNTYRYLSLGSGLVRLHRQLTLQAAPAEFFPSVCATLLQGCETDFVQIHDAVSTVLKRVVGECLDSVAVGAALTHSLENSQRSRKQKREAGPAPVLVQVAEVLEQLLDSRYQPAWLYVVSACKSLFEKVKYAGASVGSAQGMSGQDVCAALLPTLLTRLTALFQDAENGVVKVESSTHLQLGEAVGSIVRCVGFSQFVTLVPFRSDESAASAGSGSVGMDEAREWLLPVLHGALRQAPASLCDFAVVVLSIIEECQRVADSEGTAGVHVAKKARTRMLQLWSLFPDFCYYGPSDTASWFQRVLPKLEGVLKEGNSGAAGRKDVVVHVLTGLTHLAAVTLQQACPQAPREHNGVPPRVTIYNRGTVSQTPDFAAVSAAAATVLPAVLAYLEACEHGDNTFASAIRCVNAWAGVAAPSLVAAVAKKLLQLLLQSTSVGGESQDKAASGWMSILLAVVPYLSPQMVHILYKTVKPLLSVHESVSSQKRAYSILDAVLEIHGERLYEAEAATAILAVVCDSLMTCHVSARNMRLRCMERLIKNLANAKALRGGSGDSDSDSDAGDSIGDSDSDGDSDVDSDAEMKDVSARVDNTAHTEAYKIFLGAADTIFSEVLTCQKDANQKTRDSAKALLQLFVRRVTFADMMSRLLAAMGSDKRTLRASALLTMCTVLLRHRKNETVQVQVANLLPQVCALLEEENAELSRAVLTFLRVCVSILNLQTLQNILPRITAAFCSGLGDTKSRFLKRCRGIMRKLLTRLGEAALRPCVPEDSVPLLDYLLKMNRREDTKKERKVASRRNRSRSLDDVLLDSDDEKGEDDEDTAGNLMDIMSTAASSISARLGMQGQGNNKGKRDDHRIMARPRGIRPEERQDSSLPMSLNDLLEDQQPHSASAAAASRPVLAGRDRGAKRKRSSSMDDEDEEDRHAAAAPSQADTRNVEVYDPEEKFRVRIGTDGMINVEENLPAEAGDRGGAGGLGRAQRSAAADGGDTAEKSAGQQEQASNKRRKVSAPGSEYRSKKSGGDVWRKGMLEPHAYIPLDGRLLTKRNTREAVAKFDSVVKNDKSGVRVPSHVIQGNRKQRVNRRQKQGGPDRGGVQRSKKNTKR